MGKAPAPVPVGYPANPAGLTEGERALGKKWDIQIVAAQATKSTCVFSVVCIHSKF